MRTLLDSCLFLSEGNGLIDECRARRLPVSVVLLEAAVPLDFEDSQPEQHAALQARMEAHLDAVAAQPGLAACLGASTFALLLPRLDPRQAMQLVSLEIGRGLEVTLEGGRRVAFSMVARQLPGADNVLESALLRLLEDAEARLQAMDLALPAAG